MCEFHWFVVLANNNIRNVNVFVINKKKKSAEHALQELFSKKKKKKQIYNENVLVNKYTEFVSEIYHRYHVGTILYL